MSVESRNIEVVRTARYWLKGDLSGTARKIVLLLHGYGMSASECLDRFSHLEQPGVLLVSAEGLSRFYRKGFAGDVVASWMTREDRHHEIADQKTYLDRLLAHVRADLAPEATQTIVVGYSQGVATGSRWIKSVDGVNINVFVAFAGEIAPDILDSGWPSNVDVVQVCSETDEFISSAKFHEQASKLQSGGTKVRVIQYEGKHEILPETVLKLRQELGDS